MLRVCTISEIIGNSTNSKAELIFLRLPKHSNEHCEGCGRTNENLLRTSALCCDFNAR